MEKLKKFYCSYYYWLTPIFCFLAYPSYDLGIFKLNAFFGWFCFLPLFIYIFKEKKSLKSLFLKIFLVALVSNFLNFGWIGYFGAEVKGGFLVINLFLMIYLSVLTVSRFLLAEILSRKFSKLRLFLYPACWLLIDYIVSIGHLAFPWTYLGYTQYSFLPFIQLASVTGIYGITYILILFMVILANFIIEWQKSSRKILRSKAAIYLYCCFSLIAFVTIWGNYKLTENKSNLLKKDLTVAMVQSCISPWDNWNLNRYHFLRELTTLTDEALREENVDLLVWSESATLEPISYNYKTGNLDYFEQDVLDVAAKNAVALISGEVGIEYKYRGLGYSFFTYNSALYIDPSGNVKNTYYKINLVPFGEWFPYKKWFPHVNTLVQNFGGSSFSPGTAPKVFKIKDYRFGNLICYDGIFFRLCRDYAKRDVDFMVNITNDGWTDLYQGHKQHFSIYRFRAIESGCWYLRNGNTGITAIIDPYGRLTKSIPFLKKKYLVGSMDFSLNHRTFYTLFGDWLLYLNFIFLFVLLIYNCIVKIRLHKK